MAQRRDGGYLARPEPSGLADVIEVILDKGIAIDAYVRVSVVGIELLTIDARIAIASVDTYLRFAEATNRLELEQHGGRGLPGIMQDASGAVIENVAASVVENKVEDAKEAVTGAAKDVARRARDAVAGD